MRMSFKGQVETPGSANVMLLPKLPESLAGRMEVGQSDYHDMALKDLPSLIAAEIARLGGNFGRLLMER